jgi:CO/xanthine dehydrogenase FAD-binding subunit
MKSPPFDYRDPHTLDEALFFLFQYGDDAKVLAGGQSLVPLMNFRLARPAVVVDINQIHELSYILENEEEVRIGAMTRQSNVETDEGVKRNYPLLPCAIAQIAHSAIRNRGTVGGSLAHADPAAELAAVTLCADAEIKIRSRDEVRWVSSRDFFQGPYTTSLEPTEILEEVKFLKPSGTAETVFLEFSRRQGDFALVGVAAMLETNEDNSCRQARIALCGAGSVPYRAAAVERVLMGERLTLKIIKDAVSVVTEGLESYSDVHASSGYREHLARVLTYRALEMLIESAEKQTRTEKNES